MNESDWTVINQSDRCAFSTDDFSDVGTLLRAQNLTDLFVPAGRVAMLYYFDLSQFYRVDFSIGRVAQVRSQSDFSNVAPTEAMIPLDDPQELMSTLSEDQNIKLLQFAQIMGLNITPAQQDAIMELQLNSESDSYNDDDDDIPLPIVTGKL